MVESPTAYEVPVGPIDVSPDYDSKFYLWNLRYLYYRRYSYRPIECGRIKIMIPWMCSRCFRCPRNTMDIFPRHHRLCHQKPGVGRVHHYRLNEVTGSFDSIVGRQVTSLSITDYTADLSLLSEPLIPLPDELLLLPLPVPMRPIPSPEGQLPVEPITLVDPSLMALSREGPFVASCKPGDTGGHPVISAGLPGCPYRMTTYCEEDVARVDPTFGVQLHHPRFLECIGAPSLPGC